MDRCESRYHAAIDALAKIAKASGLPEEDADVNGPDETLDQVEHLVAAVRDAFGLLCNLPVSKQAAAAWCDTAVALLPPNA